MKTLASLRLPPSPHFFRNERPNRGATDLSFPVTFQLSAASATDPVVLPEPVKPIVVVGSANADVYVEIDRLPRKGETVAARSGRTLAGGKGANQACCSGRLAVGSLTFFVGRVGDDAHGRLIMSALADTNVRLDGLAVVGDPCLPSGHAVVMLQPDGENSIIIVGGSNMFGWSDDLRMEDVELIKHAGIVLLQREIPDWVNLRVAQAAKNAGVPVIMDAGGFDGPIPQELLDLVEIFSPNEIELARLTGMPTETFEQISQAAAKCHQMGMKQVLVKLGSRGSAFFVEGEKTITQPIFPAAEVVDTTGAGDTFTAAFAVALVEGKPKRECLKFAAAAASLCVQVKGAIPSMPKRELVVKLLESARPN